MIKLRSIFFAILYCFLTLSLSGCKLAILDPKGSIAADEKHLLIVAVLLMLIIVIPVIVLTLAFAWKYRASNTKATYSPNWAHSNALEVVCWSVPCVIIAILAAITWVSTHRLDPYRPLAGPEKTLTIQAIALDWKWLFIYPEQNIASVNYVQIPAHVPVRFLITADAPMNSFQIPQLGSQIYAMAGMQTKVNLIADDEGDFRGLSTNFSGDGFSDMKFVVKATGQAQFDQWVAAVQQVPRRLTFAAYHQLAKPSEDEAVEFFSLAEKDLFATVMMEYMMPMKNMTSMKYVASSRPDTNVPNPDNHAVERNQSNQ